MRNKVIVVSGLCLWGIAVWLYGQLGLLALIVDEKGHPKYCVNPFSERWGISDPVRELFFYGALAAIVVIPITVAGYLLYLWKLAKKS